MTKTMMSLGDFRFGIETAAYQKLQRSVDYRWPSQARVGRRPAKQFAGIGDDTISLDGVIYPHYKGGLGQLAQLRDLAGQGEPLILTTGTGKIMGKWCIENVTDTGSFFHPDGTPRKQEFRFKLSHYGEDS
jgi:hypothetical protein